MKIRTNAVSIIHIVVVQIACTIHIILISVIIIEIRRRPGPANKTKPKAAKTQRPATWRYFPKLIYI